MKTKHFIAIQFLGCWFLPALLGKISDIFVKYSLTESKYCYFLKLKMDYRKKKCIKMESNNSRVFTFKYYFFEIRLGAKILGLSQCSDKGTKIPPS